MKSQTYAGITDAGIRFKCRAEEGCGTCRIHTDRLPRVSCAQEEQGNKLRRK